MANVDWEGLNKKIWDERAPLVSHPPHTTKGLLYSHTTSTSTPHRPTTTFKTFSPTPATSPR